MVLSLFLCKRNKLVHNVLRGNALWFFSNINQVQGSTSEAVPEMLTVFTVKCYRCPEKSSWSYFHMTQCKKRKKHDTVFMGEIQNGNGQWKCHTLTDGCVIGLCDRDLSCWGVIWCVFAKLISGLLLWREHWGVVVLVAQPVLRRSLTSLWCVKSQISFFFFEIHCLAPKKVSTWISQRK